MRRFVFGLFGLTLIGFAGFVMLTAPRPSSMKIYEGLTGDKTKGEAVFWATGCASCHMAPGATGDTELVLAGGQSFASPFGTFLAPNISTDPKTGIGGWSLEKFAYAVVDGITAEGRHAYPAMPYAAYNKLLPQDMVDLKAFMDTLPASDVPSQPHQIGFPFNIRRTLGIWKLMFVTKDWVVQGDLSPEASRGRYIAEAMAHCGECHTPRNILGGLKRSEWLAGAPNPDGKGRSPNITPAVLKWSEDEIVEYLTTGFTPEFDSVGGHMVHVVENMSKLPESDRQAVAAYLKSVPPIAAAPAAAP